MFINNKYSGFFLDKHVEVTQSDNVLYVTGLDESDKERFIHYLGADTDYSGIKRILEQDITLKKAIICAPGIKIMNQPYFETLISFVISQNNNIPRIKKIIESLCQNFGKQIDGGYSFPTPERLASLAAEDLAVTRCGFRDKYIISAAQKYVSGEISAEKLERLDTPDVIKKLCTIKGVGPKVANCVALFSLGRYDAFPIDTWIKKIMNTYYPGGLPDYAIEYAGIAQQYLFCYARNELRD